MSAAPQQTGAAGASASRPSWRAPVTCAVVAALLVGTLHLLRRRIGFAYTDEGYLWYGVQAVLRGELPLHDFNSYDPGRYLWSAAWALLLGPGLLALRLSRAIFAAIGLTFGLLVARRALGRAWLLVPAGLVLVLWLQPPWKVFESALAMTAVWVAMQLVERPTARMHFAAGAFAGLAAFFGRNHGVYVSAGMLLLIVVTTLRARPRELPRRLAAGGGGVLVGYLPMLALIVLAPGFRESFLDSIAYFAQQGQLTGKAPIPWPWRVDYAPLDAWGRAHAFAVGVAFLLLPAFYLPSLIGLLLVRPESYPRRAAWMAATAIGAAYVHHTSIHADFYHLAQAIAPLLLGLMALPATLGAGHTLAPRLLALGFLLALSLAAGLPVLAPVVRQRLEGTPGELSPLQVGEDVVLVEPATKRYLESLEGAIRQHVGPDESIFLAPTLPGLYCLLGREAPTWDVYLVWQGTEESELRLLRELQSVEWALIADVAPGGREWIRLSSSNPRAWALLQRDFEVVPLAGNLPPRHFLLHRRHDRGPGG